MMFSVPMTVIMRGYICDWLLDVVIVVRGDVYACGYDMSLDTHKQTAHVHMTLEMDSHSFSFKPLEWEKEVYI